MIPDRYSQKRLAMLAQTGLTQNQIAARLTPLQQERDLPPVNQAIVSRWMRQATSITPRYWDAIEALYNEVMATQGADNLAK